MTDIVNINDHRTNPHMTGEARCVGCGHAWEAIAPIGTTELECPECGCIKGLFQHACRPDRGECFMCSCGCFDFMMRTNVEKETYAMCINCGQGHWDTLTDWQREDDSLTEPGNDNSSLGAPGK